MSADGIQSRFAQMVEALYARRVVAYRATGLSPEDAHRRALEEAKQSGREALEGLRQRGLFPWAGTDLQRESDCAS